MQEILRGRSSTNRPFLLITAIDGGHHELEEDRLMSPASLGTFAVAMTIPATATADIADPETLDTR